MRRAGSARRRKALGVFLGAVLILLIALIAFFLYLYHNKDALITEKLRELAGAFEERTGFTLRYEGFTMDESHGASIEGLSVYTKEMGGDHAIVTARRVSISFDTLGSSPLPVALRSITFYDPVLSLEIPADRRPILPEKTRRLIQRILNGSTPQKEDKKIPSKGGWLEKLFSSLLEMDLRFEGGRLSLIDRGFATPAPGRLDLEDLEGEVFLDIFRKRASLRARGRHPESGGQFVLNARLSREQQKFGLTLNNMGFAFLSPYVSWVHVQPDAMVNGRFFWERSASSPVRTIRFDASISGLTVDHPRLASRPVHDIRIKASGVADIDKDRRRLVLTGAKLFLGEAFVNLNGAVEAPRDSGLKLNFVADAEELPIQKILDALPADFAPVLQGARVEGSLDFRFALQMDFDKPSATRIEPRVQVRDLRVIQAPPLAEITRLNASFFHKIIQNGRSSRGFRVGASNPDFVPYEDLGRTTIGAVLTCEDGRFFRHHGFVLKHVRNSIRDNIRKEGFIRGASTVSMQTVKNLFLSHEKTVSRKFQEMLLTWWMEEAVPKKRILEIYMNIIEWGPGIYGIGPAARHYFGKTPASLSPLQAAFLASIIKNPRRYHGFYTRGYVSHGWSTMLAFILKKMAERGTITEEMVEWCDPYQPIFSKSGRRAPGGCMDPEKKDKKKEGEEENDLSPEKAKPGDAGGKEIKEEELPLNPEDFDILDVDPDLLHPTQPQLPAPGEIGMPFAPLPSL